LLLALERAPADELALVELDHPREAGLERRALLVDVVAVQDVAHLEAERVPGAETRGDHALRLAHLEDATPERDRVLVRHVQLEAVLARVTGAADDGGPAIDGPFDEVVVGDPV